MPDRPKEWKQVINAGSETCYWLASDGTRHPGTDDENREVKRQLLEIRTVSEKRLRDRSESR